jgi:hypothetical protein
MGRIGQRGNADEEVEVEAKYGEHIEDIKKGNESLVTSIADEGGQPFETSKYRWTMFEHDTCVPIAVAEHEDNTILKAVDEELKRKTKIKRKTKTTKPINRTHHP